MYSEKVMDHFNHPRNVGEIENPSGVGTVGNAKCGDIMRMYLDIDDNGIIQDVKFKTFGCGAAVATSSVPMYRFIARWLKNPKSNNTSWDKRLKKLLRNRLFIFISFAVTYSLLHLLSAILHQSGIIINLEYLTSKNNC